MKVLLVSNTSWYLYNFRLSLAKLLQDGGVEVIFVSPFDPYTIRIKELGFEHINLIMNRSSTNPISDSWAIRQLIRIYRSEKPDLVHHFTSKCILYGSFAAKLTGIQKIVNSITGMGYVFSGNGLFQKLLQPLVVFLYKISLRKTRVIFQNEDDKYDFLKTYRINSIESHVIKSSGVDLDKFHPSIEPDGIPMIILAARMLRDKGIYEFVEAANILRTRKVNSKMVLVGEPDLGNPSSISYEQLKAWDESNMIEWWGWKDEMDLVYSQANIVCLPSYREGLPKSLIEAAASGLPIVTTDTNGCRDVVLDGVNGYLVPVRDTNKLADALQTLILDSELRKKMGKMSRKMAEEKFDVKNINQATINVYELGTE